MYTSPDVFFARPRLEKHSVFAVPRASFGRIAFEVSAR